MKKRTTPATPWERERPGGPATKLTPASKAAAKKRAAKAGRKYPNLVDNMHAAMKQNSPAKAGKKN